MSYHFTVNLTLAFDATAQRRASKTAIFWGEHEFSYADIAQQSEAVAQILGHQLGVKPGDRVGLWLKNCPEFVSAVYGILRAGAVVVPINNFLKLGEIKYILTDAGIDVLITDGELGAHSPALSDSLPSLRILKVEDFPRRSLPGPAQYPTRAESDLAVIIYTSGTTGRPKGAMLSHGNLLCNVESCRIVLETVPDDRFAVLLPLFHTYMMTVGIFLPFTAGGSVVLIKSLHPPRAALHEIISRRATILPAIPAFYRAMLAAQVPVPLPVRVFISGSAPLPLNTLKGFEEKFGVPLIEGYGLSEASPVVSKNPIKGVRKAGSIGLPIPNVEMSVQDDAGRMLGPAETGEICVRGGNVMQGYWNQPEETAKVFRNGWLLTGDIGYRDADGYYYITDRKKDMLKVNGNNVYPREIEEILYQFPGVKEAAVIGVPDLRRGEAPVAYVAPADGLNLDELAVIQFLRERLADFKVPRRVVFMPALPRNATGKILKIALREGQSNGFPA